MTFAQHPKAVLLGRAPRTLTTIEHRLALFARAGVRHAVVMTFDEELRNTAADDFARRYLEEGLGTRAFVLGFDSKFGKDRAGGPDSLRARGHEVEIAEKVMVGQRAVSSTAIREAVELGDLEGAARMLGRPLTVYGEVVKGRRSGAAWASPPPTSISSTNSSPPPASTPAALTSCPRRRRTARRIRASARGAISRSRTSGTVRRSSPSPEAPSSRSTCSTSKATSRPAHRAGVRGANPWGTALRRARCAQRGDRVGRGVRASDPRRGPRHAPGTARMRFRPCSRPQRHGPTISRDRGAVLPGVDSRHVASDQKRAFTPIVRVSVSPLSELRLAQLMMYLKSWPLA